MYEFNLGARFENIVRQYPDNTAIKFSQSVFITYKELNNKVNQLARYLLEKEIGQGDVVCISGNKQINTYACMLACLKIGAIYSVLDDKSPYERSRRIISKCLPKAIFLDQALGCAWKGIIEQFNITVINNEAEDLEDELRVYDKTNLEVTRGITGSNPAYIMFTSGSTGFPKGALMTHDNLLNLIRWGMGTFNICPTDVLTNVNPLYFDNSVFDFSSALFSGACLVPFSRELLGNPKLLVGQVDELECTLWFSVPSLLIYLDTMKVLNKNNLKFIKRFIFGGEGYPKTKLKNLYEMYSHRSDFFNVYGPTECTCICSAYKVTSKDFEDLNGLPPLGKIADNFSYLILDDNHNKAAPNDAGELCLLGPNVGKGYYNDMERTREKFVQNPYNTSSSEIMYKTGDLVRYNPKDDNIYFVGRKDNQIKHMGYRIEIEEIEVALGYLDYISQAAVLHGNFRGLSQIIAVVSSSAAIDEKRVRDDLRQTIPDYMIPNRVLFIEGDLPKNPNGKIDRRKLAEVYLTQLCP
jgi:D-alanine--poly(phosphoribitol) ligase subunit 1